MSENQGRREPGQQKEGKGVSRRRFVGGVVVVGGLALLAYLYRDKLKTLFIPPGDGKTTAETTIAGGTTTRTTTTEGTTTRTTEIIETTEAITTTTTTGTTTTASTTSGTTATTSETVTATTSVTLTAPEMPSEMLRPYLTIRISGLTHGSGGSPDVLDIFLVNGGYGASTAFFDIYGWQAPSGTGTITTRTASRSGKARKVLESEPDIFPLSFPSSRCIFLTREMIALPPGAAIARSVSLDRSLMDGIWGILYDPILDPAMFTISNADYFATDDGQRKYIYCGV
jgi:hypothetical protein